MNEEEPMELSDGEEKGVEPVPAEPDAPRLPIQHLLLFGRPVISTRNAFLLRDAFEFSFADRGFLRKWVVPIKKVKRVTIATEGPSTIWIAMNLERKKQGGKSADQIIFAAADDSSESPPTSPIMKYLHETYLILITDCVELLPFISRLPVPWRPIIRNLIENGNDRRIFADGLKYRKPPAQEERPVLPLLVTEVIVRFSNGAEYPISSQHLRRLTRPDGWLSTDVMDAALARFVCEEIPQLPFWEGRITVMESVFLQRLFRYETQFDEGVNSSNYERILNAVYPKKGKIRKGVVDIRKELIVVPVILEKHWFVVLIHRPETAKFDLDIERDSFKGLSFSRRTCRIIILDSKIHDPLFAERMTINHPRLFHLMEQWVNLMILAMDEFPHELGFSRHVCNKIPVQSNDSDCGVYMLMFFQQLITEDWSWLDLPDKELETMPVGEQEEFAARAAEYRDKLREAFKERASEWPDFGVEA